MYFDKAGRCPTESYFVCPQCTIDRKLKGGSSKGKAKKAVPGAALHTSDLRECMQRAAAAAYADLERDAK